MKKAAFWVIVLCALAGIGIMSYLTYIHYSQSKSFCDISQEVSCDVVTTSIYSEIFGIPVSVLGLLFFAAVLFLVIKRRDKAFQTLFIVTLFALIPSLYLSVPPCGLPGWILKRHSGLGYLCS